MNLSTSFTYFRCGTRISGSGGEGEDTIFYLLSSLASVGIGVPNHTSLKTVIKTKHVGLSDYFEYRVVARSNKIITILSVANVKFSLLTLAKAAAVATERNST